MTKFESATNEAAVEGSNSGNGPGIKCSAKGNPGTGAGVWAECETWEAVHAVTSGKMAAAVSAVHNGIGPAIAGKAKDGAGVRGEGGRGVWGHSEFNLGIGVFGESLDGEGVLGRSNHGIGVRGESADVEGVYGKTGSVKAAVAGINTGSGQGVWGESKDGIGVHGESDNAEGVYGKTGSVKAAVAGINIGSGQGVWGSSVGGEGVYGETGSVKAAVAGINTGQGQGVWAECKTNQGEAFHARGGRYAGHFEGIVLVTGDVQLQNEDCAEDFAVLPEEHVDAGTVMALRDDGCLERSMLPYDKRVAGVVSGAGDFKPGLILGRKPGQEYKLPIALMGKVYCKVNADYGSIEVGDLLTTSATPGYAMKASDPSRAFGAVIGKALRPLKMGSDLLPILVSLQ